MPPDDDHTSFLHATLWLFLILDGAFLLLLLRL
jgi:hypothetical protein